MLDNALRFAGLATLEALSAIEAYIVLNAVQGAYRPIRA
jgi:hypothetical protein